MKGMNHSGEEKRNKQSYQRAAVSSRAETAVFATLGLTGLLAVVLAMGSGSVPAGSKEELAIVKYFRSGRWIADARTAKAMVNYIFESEKPLVTNVIEPSPTKTNLAMPTNNAARDPKA